MRARRIDTTARSKYHATPTVVDGFRFASMAEARRYRELLLMQRAKQIHNLELQPPFDLKVVGAKGVVRVGRYVADFRYDLPTGESVVEDVKGVKTALYRLKKKMVEAQYGIQITEVTCR